MPHEAGRIVAILRGIEPENVVGVADVLREAGIGAIEIPLNSPRPFDSIARLSTAFGEGMPVRRGNGAGGGRRAPRLCSGRAADRLAQHRCRGDRRGRAAEDAGDAGFRHRQRGLRRHRGGRARPQALSRHDLWAGASEGAEGGAASGHARLRRRRRGRRGGGRMDRGGRPWLRLRRGAVQAFLHAKRNRRARAPPCGGACARQSDTSNSAPDNGADQRGGNHASLSSRYLRRRRLCGVYLRAGAMGVAREGGAPKDQPGLLPGLPFAALVGHRHLADRGQHLRRADHRHVGLWLCDRARHRLLRMDERADADHRRQVFPADLPEEPDLHDAGVPAAPLRPQRAAGDGDLLAGRLRVRESHGDPVAGRHRRAHHHRHAAGDGAGRARPLRRRLCALWRAEGHRAHRCGAGGAAGAGRARHRLYRAGEDRRRCGRAGGLPCADAEAARAFRHDPVARQPQLQGPAGPLGADRRHVDHEFVLLGLQPVHHPARAGRKRYARGPARHRAGGIPQALDAGAGGAAGNRGGDPGAEPDAARRGPIRR